MLEDAGIKLAVVATDIMGKSGRDMITALIAGQRDPHVLADLTRRQMRTKVPALTEALDGRFTDHHALLCQMMLNRIDGVDATVAALDEQIAAATECFAETIDELIAIPGVARRTAEVIVAETGADMSRFPTAADLASWAGMCPGNNESAGKHFTGRTRQGNPGFAAHWVPGQQQQATPKGPTSESATTASPNDEAPNARWWPSATRFSKPAGTSCMTRSTMSTSAPTTTSASETQPDERADLCNSCVSWATR